MIDYDPRVEAARLLKDAQVITEDQFLAVSLVAQKQDDDEMNKLRKTNLDRVKRLW